MTRTDASPAGTPVAPPATPTVVNRLHPTTRTTVVVAPAPDAPRPRAPVVALLALVLLGGGLRTVALLSDRCLWIDEAMLALNLVHRTPAQLLAPLDYNQGAPVGFLLACKTCVEAFGAAEWSLRLVPFVGSVLGLVAFAWFARRVLSPVACLLAVGLFALSPHIISYAAECKQYATDAAIAVGLFAVAAGLLEGKGGFARWAALALAGAAAVWCSHPSAFVLGGIGTALLAHALLARDRTRFLAAGLTVACWLASFGTSYVLLLKDLGNNKFLTDYWAGHFLPLPPKSPGDLAWVVDHYIAFFSVPGGFGWSLVPLGGLAAALALVGLREFLRERWTLAVALGTIPLLVLFASGLHKYPLGGRLLLFLVPLAVLLVARGAAAVLEAVREKNRFAAFALLGLIVLAPMWEATEVLRRPLRHEQLDPVLEQVRGEYRPGDRVYVYYGAGPAFTFYTRDNPFPADAVTVGAEHRDDPAAVAAELTELRGRVWVIVSHRHHDEESVIRATLDTRGRCEREITRPGAAAYLYDLRDDPRP